MWFKLFIIKLQPYTIFMYVTSPSSYNTLYTLYDITVPLESFQPDQHIRGRGGLFCPFLRKPSLTEPTYLTVVKPARQNSTYIATLKRIIQLYRSIYQTTW